MSEQGKGSLKIYKSAGQLFWHNLFGGIAWGVGSVLGATVVIGILGLILNWLGGMPIIGRFIGDVMDNIRQGMIR